MSIRCRECKRAEWERCEKSRTFAIRITHVSDSAAQAITDVICTNQPPGACEIKWVDTVDAGRRRLRDGTTMTYVIILTQDVSDVSMNATTALLTAATINAALVATGNGNVVITTEPVQDQAALSLTITTTAKGSTCVKGNEGVMCAVCKSLGGLSRCSEVHVTHAARSPLLHAQALRATIALAHFLHASSAATSHGRCSLRS